jgi:hypothetical protein
MPDAGPVGPVTVAGDPFSVTDLPDAGACAPDDAASAAGGKTATASATASARVSEANTAEPL